MRSLPGLVPPEVSPCIRNLVHMVELLPRQHRIAVRTAAGMDQDRVLAFADVDEVRPDAAHRADRPVEGAALEDGQETRDLAFREHLVQQVRRAQPRLRPRLGVIVDHHQIRPAVDRPLQRFSRERRREGGSCGRRRTRRSGRQGGHARRAGRLDGSVGLCEQAESSIDAAAAIRSHLPVMVPDMHSSPPFPS